MVTTSELKKYIKTSIVLDHHTQSSNLYDASHVHYVIVEPIILAMLFNQQI